MARTIDDINNEIISRVTADPALSDLTSSSTTAIWKLWSFVVSAVTWTLEKLFDEHKGEVTGLIEGMKPGSLKWYAAKALEFQYGYDLAPDEDHYDNTGLTDEQILAAKVVTYCAVVEQDKVLRVKVARTVGDDLAPLTADQKAAFTEYMKRVTYAGVKLVIDSLSPDGLKLSLKVYYNPLVLGQDGSRLDGTVSDPIGDAIHAYLRALPFNGTLVLAYLIDALQQVDGIVIPHLVDAQAQYGLFPYAAINVQYNPDAGYLRLLQDSDLTVEYIPQSVIK